MASAIESLLEACERRTGEVGLLTMRNHADKRQAYFYLREGKIYAIQVDELIPPIYKRLVNTGRVDMVSDLESAIRSVGGEDSLQLPFVISQRQLADEDEVAEVVKDFFLEAAAEALAWESVKTSWKSNIVFNEYPIPPLEGGRLVSIVSSRSMKFQQVAEAFTSSYENVFNEVTVKATPNPPADGFANHEERAIFRITLDSFTTLGGLMDTLGLTRVSVMKHTYALWHKGGLDVFVNGRNIRQDESVEDEDELVLELDAPSTPESVESEYGNPSYDEPIDGVGGSNTVLPAPDLHEVSAPVEPLGSVQYEDVPTLTIPDFLPQREEENSDSDLFLFGDDEEEAAPEEAQSWSAPATGTSFDSSIESFGQETAVDAPSGLQEYEEDPFAYEKPTVEVVQVSEGDMGRYGESEQVDSESNPVDPDEVANLSEEDEQPAEEFASPADEEDEDKQVPSVVAPVAVKDEGVSDVPEEEAAGSSPTGGASGIFAELQAMLSKAKDAVEDSERKIVQVDSELSAISQTVEDSRQEKKSVEEEIESLTSRIAALTGRLNEISTNLEDAERQEAELRKVRNEEEEKMAEFNTGLESLRSMMGR